MYEAEPIELKVKAISILTVVLTVEKIFQHLFSALAFMGSVPGLRVPDMGPYFAIGNSTMLLLNLFFALFFIIGLLGITRHLGWGMSLVIAIAAMDIILESLFHGLLYITISFIVSSILIIIIVHQMKTKTGYPRSNKEVGVMSRNR